MTKEELIKIIEANKDVLTPQNYQRVLKNADIFTDEEKAQIVAHLTVANQAIQTNREIVEKQNELYQETGDKLKVIDEKIVKETKEAFHKADVAEGVESSKEADQLISNL